MRKLKHIIFCFCLIAVCSADLPAQQYSLFSHFHDLPVYYNPAFGKGGKYSEVGLAHRSQWTQLNYPVVNTLFFTYPPQMNLPLLDFNSVGLIVQHENYDFIKRTTFQVFSSNALYKTKRHSLNVGLNTGIYLNAINTSELNLAEIADSQLISLDGSSGVVSRLGFSFDTRQLQAGLAGSINTFTGFSDVTASLRGQLNVNSAFKLMPGLVYRLSANTKSQLEPQIRTVFNQKVAFTLGYRQEYGALFQLSILFDKLKTSYGIEMPSGDNAALGPTHEILVTYRFKLENAARLERDSLMKKRRDSINAYRLDSLRKARISQYITKEQPEEVEEIAPEEPTDTPSSTENSAPKIEGVIEFDDIPRHMQKDNTHVVMRNINFETGYDILKPYAYHELDKLVIYLRHNHRFNIEIQGHTDDIGTNADNLELSYRRALIVYNYLISRGIDAARMMVNGYGEEHPLLPNSSDENRRLNRRIEVVFMKKSE